MRARVLKTGESQNWDEFVMKEPYAIAWQLFEWSLLVDRHYGAQFYPLVIEEDDKIVGILPLYRIKPLKGSPRMISVPHAVAGGILAEAPQVRKALLDAAVKIGTDCGAQGLTLKQYKLKLEGELTTDDNYYNRELDLSGSTAAVWERITQENRNAILATKGVPLILEHPAGDLTSFYRYLLRHHRRKGVPCVSQQWVRDLVDLGMYSAAVLKRDKQIVAATMVKEFKDTVSFPFTCSSGDTRTDHLPVYRLYWELMTKYSEMGYRICHSGRIPKTDDVDPYRLGWGGTKHPYYYQYYPPHDQKTTEFAHKHSWKRNLFSSAWKLIPLPMAGFLGPYVVRQFP